MDCALCPNLDSWDEPCTSPKTKLTATEFELEQGDTIQVKGMILPGATEFSVNLGEDCDNLILHFNPCFDNQNDTSSIICMSKKHGVWGKEERITDFPFEKGGKFKLSFILYTYEIKVQLAAGHDIFFPNRLGLETIKYVAVEGDVRIKALRFLRLS
ncbi:16 kDa beta-galactoside-binding lectin-like [Podarcis lilfordi]|uniref:Galectin n=1 Tax=Podarcis lilfordi TaxID=74358 RepID=A0AA35PDD9_9SAUR|nr:16 kDa beta-galactoside-binding lectin-like [Podarcis lilfordi]